MKKKKAPHLHRWMVKMWGVEKSEGKTQMMSFSKQAAACTALMPLEALVLLTIWRNRRRLGHEGHEVLLVEAHPLNHHLADLALAVLDAGLVGVIDVGVEVEEAEADAGLVGPLDHGANLVRVARVHVVEAVRDHHDVDVRLGATLGLEPVREEHCTWCFLEDTPVQRGHSTLGLRGVLAAFEPR